MERVDPSLVGTAHFPPLLGLLPMLAITGGLLIFWLAIGYVLIQQERRRPTASSI